MQVGQEFTSAQMQNKNYCAKHVWSQVYMPQL
jgi:hypothetical protein